MNRHFRDIDPLPRLTPVAKPEQAPSKPTWRLLGRPYLETDGRRMRYVPLEPPKAEAKVPLHGRRADVVVCDDIPETFSVGSRVILPAYPNQKVGLVTAEVGNLRRINWPDGGYKQTTESIQHLKPAPRRDEVAEGGWHTGKPPELHGRFRVGDKVNAPSGVATLIAPDDPRRSEYSRPPYANYIYADGHTDFCSWEYLNSTKPA